MNDFERVKDALSIKAVIVNQTGMSMKGKHLSECPFCKGHDCFSIKEDEGFYKCFQCDEGGDVITFLEKHLAVDKSEALLQGAKIAGITLTPIESKKKKEELSVKDVIFLKAMKHYHGHLKENGGREYFEKRKHSFDLLDKMKVGWSDGKLFNVLLKDHSEEDLIASGLVRKKKGENGDGDKFYDLFPAGLAVFPHFNGKRVIHFTQKDPEKAKKHQLPAKYRSDWLFYNQTALYRHDELIVVEGENDLLSVMGSGVSYVIGIIGQVSDDQIKALKKHCAGKHLYLWFDNDEAGHKYVRKVCDALVNENIRIIVHDKGEDPDDFLQSLPTNKRRESVKNLKEESLTAVAWEIRLAGQIEGLDNRYKALKDREVFRVIADMVEIEQNIYFEKLQNLGFKESAILEELDSSQDLLQEIGQYNAVLVNPRDADPNKIASIIFKSFARAGRFFVDKAENVYLLYQHYIYTVAFNRPFNALIKKTTGYLPTKEPGRSVWESLASEAYNNGSRIDLASWSFTNRTINSIYLNLNSPNNVILKISEKSVDEIPNGLNDEGVLLKSSPRIMPLNYRPDCGIQEGFKKLHELLFDSMTCEVEQRYLILSWLIAGFLLELSPYTALMKFSGASSAGKTTAAKFMSILLFGTDHLGEFSTAAAYAEASSNPLVIIDNLESIDMNKGIAKFLLLSTTRGGKVKRTQGTESGTTEEQPRALVLITAIEPFLKAEMINRTFDVDFSLKYKRDDFIEDEIIRQLMKHRDLMLSAIVKFIHKEILPNLNERKEYMLILKKEYRGHSKDRTDEFLSLMMVILSHMLKYIPYYAESHPLHEIETGDKEIRKAWIAYQDSRARDTEVSSNSIIKLLDGIVKDYMQVMNEKDITPEPGEEFDQIYRYTHPEYMLEMVKTEPEIKTDPESGEPYTEYFVEFVATSGDVVQAFDRLARNYGFKNPYPTASILSARLRNDKVPMKKGGWVTLKKNNDPTYWRKVKGQRFYKFRKIVVR